MDEELSFQVVELTFNDRRTRKTAYAQSMELTWPKNQEGRPRVLQQVQAVYVLVGQGENRDVCGEVDVTRLTGKVSYWIRWRTRAP